MVLDDLNLIIRDIREFHKKDSESAPQTTVADELKENLEAVENFKGIRDEKLVILYCKQLGINYKNLSEEEFRWFIRILKKSKKMGTPISQTTQSRSGVNGIYLFRRYIFQTFLSRHLFQIVDCRPAVIAHAFSLRSFCRPVNHALNTVLFRGGLDSFFALQTLPYVAGVFGYGCGLLGGSVGILFQKGKNGSAVKIISQLAGGNGLCPVRREVG